MCPLLPPAPSKSGTGVFQSVSHYVLLVYLFAGFLSRSLE